MTVRQKREQIEELMESLQNIDFNTKEVREAIMANEDEIIRMQQEQMWAGITAGGQSIEPFYEPRTVKAKQKKGQPTDRVTLKDKGNFYDNMFVQIKEEELFEDQVYIDSNVEYAKYLRARYHGIFGLTEPNILKLSEIINKYIIDHLNGM